MRGLLKWAGLFCMVVGFCGSRVAGAQASFAATQQLELSAYGGATGNWTGLDGGRNIGITAGIDLALPTYRRFRPVLEVRGTYPVKGGQIDAQKEFLGGLRVERQYTRWHPYVDVLAGRGQLNYQSGGFTYGAYTYLFSTSMVYSGGGGVDVDLSHHFALRGDFQVQHWDTPFPSSSTAIPIVIVAGHARPETVVVSTAPETIYPKMATVGVVYRFDFNHHWRRRR